MGAREQARAAGVLRQYVTALRRDLAEAAADAASDVWEPIALAFRDHRIVMGTSRCSACGDRWPCEAWDRAVAATTEAPIA